MNTSELIKKVKSMGFSVCIGKTKSGLLALVENEEQSHFWLLGFNRMHISYCENLRELLHTVIKTNK